MFHFRKFYIIRSRLIVLYEKYRVFKALSIGMRIMLMTKTRHKNNVYPKRTAG
jgi:hypothetical protein